LREELVTVEKEHEGMVRKIVDKELESVEKKALKVVKIQKRWQVDEAVMLVEAAAEADLNFRLNVGSL